MVANPLSLAPVVSNTSPARPPSATPIYGEHVRLERLTRAHYADLWEHVGSPPHADLWTWWPEGPHGSVEEFNSSLDDLLKLMPADLAVYAIRIATRLNAGPACGLAMALSKDRDTHRTAEMGLFFGPRLSRTRAGTEVAFLLADMMFASNHRRLAWATNSLNAESRRASERFGFVLEGTWRQAQINKGRSRDTCWYSIIDSEWPLCREAFKRWLDDGNFDAEGRQRRRLQDIRADLEGGRLFE